MVLRLHNVPAMNDNARWPFLPPALPRRVNVRPMSQKELLDMMGITAGWLEFDDTGPAAGFFQPPGEEDAGWPNELPPLQVAVVAVSQEELLQLVAGSRSTNL